MPKIDLWASKVLSVHTYPYLLFSLGVESEAKILYPSAGPTQLDIVLHSSFFKIIGSPLEIESQSVPEAGIEGTT